MYENNWEAENEDQLRKRVSSWEQKVDKNLIQCICEHLNRKTDAVRRNSEKVLLQS